MEHIVSLPEYDVVAYLVAGLAALAVADLIFGTRIFFRSNWNLAATTAIVIVAYVLGHIVAVCSTYTIENYIVNGALSSPTTYLMTDNCSPKEQPYHVFYFAPFECSTQKKIHEKLDKDPRTKGIESANLFWEAYNNAKQNDDAFKRIVTFHEQYSFSRNISFVAFLAALAVILRSYCHAQLKIEDWEKNNIPGWLQWPGRVCVAFLLIGLVFFMRYLYFYRAHSIEVLTSYAYAAEPDKRTDTK